MFVLNIYSDVKASEIVGIISKVVPAALSVPLQAMLTDDLVIAGGIIMGNGQEEEVVGVTDMIEYASSHENYTPVSELHFLPPGYCKSFQKVLHGALNQLLRSVRKRMHGQLDKSQRRAAMSGCTGEIFYMLAEKEHEAGTLITAEGDRLKVWFETTEELHSTLGEFEFSSRYNAGTPFTLQPPFGILWNPSKDTCWIRCAPEKVELPSGQEYCSKEDVKIIGAEGETQCIEIPATEVEILNKI